jgi:hypothetical protein
VALVRITAAMVWLPLWYLGLGTAMIRSGWNPGSTVTVLALMAAGGALAWDGWRFVHHGWERARLAWLARRHPRLVARTRSLQSALVEELEALGTGEAE